MQQEITQHTLAIFKRLYDFVVLVLPSDLKKEMAHALDHFENDVTLSLDELEKTMVVFGKKVWPYRKALLEMIVMQEGQTGEKFLRAKLSRGMKQKFDAFLASGGSLRDLHTGHSINNFSSDEKQELCVALVELSSDIKNHIAQSVHSTRKKDFEKRVNDFTQILKDLETRLDSLRDMADSEQDHPQLAEEIRDQISGFEFGLCALGPEINYEAVCQAKEHFQGRKHYFKKVRVPHT